MASSARMVSVSSLVSESARAVVLGGVEVLGGAATLEEEDRAVARGGASGRGRTVGAGAPGRPWRPSLLSRGQGSGKQLDDLSDAGVLVAAVVLVGSRASASGGGGTRGGAGAPGASAKGGAVPVVPVADLDNGAEQGAVLGLSGVGVLVGGADTPSRTSASSISLSRRCASRRRWRSARGRRRSGRTRWYVRRAIWRGAQ